MNGTTEPQILLRWKRTRMLLILWLAAASSGIAPAATGEQAEHGRASDGLYEAIDLGKPSGYTEYDVYAYGINSTSQIVGALQIPATIPEVASAFVWEDGEMTILPTLPNSPANVAVARAINDAGQIVGWADAYPEPPEGYIGHNSHAVMWEKIDGQWQIFDLAPDSDYHRAESINNLGQVAIWYFGSPDKYANAYVWLPEPACDFPEPGMHAIEPDDPKESKSWAINDHGNVAGRSDFQSPPVVWNAWLWECDGQNDSILSLYAEPRDINNDNIIVGAEGIGVYEASVFSYDPYQGWQSITLPTPDAGFSRANALNDPGDVVGWFGVDQIERQACLWRDQGDLEYEYVGLDELVPPPTSWVFSEATDINAAHDIVGNASARR